MNEKKLPNLLEKINVDERLFHRTYFILKFINNVIENQNAIIEYLKFNEKKDDNIAKTINYIDENIKILKTWSEDKAVSKEAVIREFTLIKDILLENDKEV